MREFMKIILPLDTLFGSNHKRKKSDITFSLNSFMIPLAASTPKIVSYYYQKKAKKFLQHIVEEQLIGIDPLTKPYPKKAVLRIYAPDNRHRDGDNFAILFKFALDEIKKTHIPDDDFRYIVAHEILYCGLDKKDPRAELTIRDISEIDLMDWQDEEEEDETQKPTDTE